MIKSNLSDTDKSIMIVNHLIISGTIRKIVESMVSLDTRYTVNTDREGVALYTEQLTEFIVDVELYRSRNPWSRAYATTYTGNYNLIKLNSRRLNRSIASVCGSIAHELGHCLEYYIRERVPMVKFNHGDNSPVGKDTTFQYQLGRGVKTYVEEFGNGILQNLRLN